MTPENSIEPAWLQVARLEIGQHEIPGPKDNPRIVEYHKTTLGVAADEVPWCSSFVNWCMFQAGVERTRSAAALSWLRWGYLLVTPALGAVAVIDWGGGKGHVGFVVGRDRLAKTVALLGGNQSDQVKISHFAESVITGYRWPRHSAPSPAQHRLEPSGSQPVDGVDSTR